MLKGHQKILQLHEHILSCRHGAPTDGEFNLNLPSNVWDAQFICCQ